MKRTPDEIRSKRRAFLRPLFLVLSERGIQRKWFATQLGIRNTRLWMFETGQDRVPPWFVERGCQVLGIPTSFLSTPEPPELYIQQKPRAPRTPQMPRTAVSTTPESRPESKPASKPAKKSKPKSTKTRTKGPRNDSQEPNTSDTSDTSDTSNLNDAAQPANSNRRSRRVKPEWSERSERSTQTDADAPNQPSAQPAQSAPPVKSRRRRSA